MIALLVALILAATTYAHLAKIGVTSPPKLGNRCTGAHVKADCGNYKGIFTSIDGKPFFTVQYSFLYQPLEVAVGSRVVILVCNFGRKIISSSTEFNQILVPTLIKSVGSKAIVTIHVQKSALVYVLGSDLVFMPSLKSKPALIGELIKGPIGESAQISIDISESGNVVLSGKSKLTIRGTALAKPLISAVGCIKVSCIDVMLNKSISVVGHGKETLDLEAGHFLTTAIQANCVSKSNIRVDTRDCGGTGGIRDLSLSRRSSFVFNVAAISQMVDSHLSFESSMSHGFSIVNRAILVDSFNIESVFALSEVKSSLIAVSMTGAAGAMGDQIHLGNSAFVKNVVSVNELWRGMVHVYLRRTAGCVANDLHNFQALGSAVRIAIQTVDSKVYAILNEVGSSQAKKISYLLGGSIVNSAVDVELSGKTWIDVWVNGSANIIVADTARLGQRRSLLRNAVALRVATTGSYIGALVTDSANVYCNFPGAETEMTDGSSLVENFAKVQSKNVSVELDVRRTANIYTKIKGKLSFFKSIVSGQDSVYWIYLREQFMGKKFTCGIQNLLPKGSPIHTHEK